MSLVQEREPSIYVEQPPAVGNTRLLGVVMVLGGLILLSLLGYEVILNGPKGSPTDQILNPQADPIQHDLASAEPIYLSDWISTWELTPRATYDITARVARKKVYWDSSAHHMPIDLALAWGDLSDPAVDDEIRWRQYGRWYYVSFPTDGSPSGPYIMQHSANVHIIPANSNISRALTRVSQNDVVRLEGALVDIRVDNYTSTTSLTRYDEGGGACEILYVERLTINGMTYE